MRKDRARASASAAAWALALCTCIAACGGASAPRPTESAQPQSAFVPVAYPPPPGRVEFVPRPPIDGAVWVDGEWDYRWGRWFWTYGRWLIPPEGAKYARWALKRDKLGELWFAPGSWRDDEGHVVDSPEPLRRGYAGDRRMKEEDGTYQEVAPNQPPPPPLPADANAARAPKRP